MTMQEMLQSDFSLPFQDWGETVEYWVVSRLFDVQTQQVEETIESTSLRALVSTIHDNRVQATAGLSTGSRRELVVRSSDLPEDAPQLTDRVKVGEDVFQITGFRQEQRGDVTVLQVAR